MDFQAMIDGMNESQARDRGNYHLNYGQLIKALKAAPKGAKYDKRIKGIGSWRGSYTEIAIYTDSPGANWEDEEYTGSYGDDYNKWAKEHDHSVDKLPESANELATFLESLLGKDFVGYKGGNFTIQEYKPIWLTTDDSNSGNTAVIGIDKDLNLLTKEIEY